LQNKSYFDYNSKIKNVFALRYYKKTQEL